ncbi:glycerophosphodiester phosphodiesterase [Ramlibacter algicola]|uniref:Glycerophosphodiester phosphodiesterase n=1 Tax=Ramlibacter algicola TaxID=2795217 RepID=A0A934Q4I8_9BURK|nr:glycerophosphodiester phosphodiesterase [Ramlibacter algicola]MBK0394124.1 glycerophosphodiester phosphodiesterase [Ramlibacter algicola]
MRRLLALTLATCAFAAHAIDLQGHRGARGLRPENTLPAFEHALRLGVTTLEMDAAITSDGVVVISHDPALNPDLVRGADGQWITTPVVIRSITYEQTQAYDVGRLRPGGSYGKSFPDQQPVDGTRIPKLAEVFELVKRLKADHVQFDIETKIDLRNPQNTLEPEPFVQKLLEVIRAHGMEDRVMVQSFDWRTLQVLHKLAPRMRTVYLTTQSPRGSNLDSPIYSAGFTLAQHGSVPAMVKAAGGTTWSPNYQALTPDLVKQGQALGLQVIPWTVNEEADMGRLLDWGVDGIISDRPDRVRNVLKARGLPLPPAVAAP